MTERFEYDGVTYVVAPLTQEMRDRLGLVYVDLAYAVMRHEGLPTQENWEDFAKTIPNTLVVMLNKFTTLLSVTTYELPEGAQVPFPPLPLLINAKAVDRFYAWVDAMERHPKLLSQWEGALAVANREVQPPLEESASS